MYIVMFFFDQALREISDHGPILNDFGPDGRFLTWEKRIARFGWARMLGANG